MARVYSLKPIKVILKSRHHDHNGNLKLEVEKQPDMRPALQSLICMRSQLQASSPLEKQNCKKAYPCSEHPQTITSVKTGLPATGPPLIIGFSIWHWLWPRSILKNPWSPQSSFQLLATSQ
mmetsp:Transcript_51945/g.82641  ORF Transcript_51945/g.82641 Transcript_51945/m.82641 type:complete len:121 (+) Transcript_51945:21-383(+)